MQSYGQQVNMPMPRPVTHENYGPPPSAGSLQDAMCTKQPAVAIALDRLADNVTSISQILDILEQRLLPVLRNEPQPPMKDELCDGVVPLSQAITGSVVSLAKAKDRLGSILNRLEL